MQIKPFLKYSFLSIGKDVEDTFVSLVGIYNAVATVENEWQFPNTHTHTHTHLCGLFSL